MASIKAIRSAIQDAVDDISTLHVYDKATGTERLSRPVVLIFPRPGGGRITAGGTYRRLFELEVHCPLGMGLARAQDVLDDLIDDGSTSNLEDTVETDKTLDSLVSSIRVDEFTAYGFSELNGQDTLMLRVPMEVLHD